MSEKTKITIKDFNLFYDIIKTLSKVVKGTKFSVGDCGLTVYARNDKSKYELTSNSISTDKDISFCIGDLSTLFKILTTVKTIYENDFSQINLYYDAPFLKIESKKFKTKLSTASEEAVGTYIGNKVHTTLTPCLEFTTNSELIKSINSHSFIFNDSSEPRIYLNTDSEMENNIIFARIGNESNDLANSVTLELGMLNYGSFEDKKVIIDFDRLNYLNIIPSEEIKVQLASERPVLISNVKKDGINGAFYNINIYVFLMIK